MAALATLSTSVPALTLAALNAEGFFGALLWLVILIALVTVPLVLATLTFVLHKGLREIIRALSSIDARLAKLEASQRSDDSA